MLNDICKNSLKDVKVFWLFGLSGAGKTTVANELTRTLLSRGQLVCLLDGDIIRTGLCKDLGFSEKDRTENIRRVAECAALLANAGVNVVAAFITPLESDREMARAIVGDNRFVGVYIDTSLGVCERRDPKGIYAKARAGLIKNFTGIDAPFEGPESVAVRIETERVSPEEAVAAIVRTALGQVKE